MDKIPKNSKSTKDTYYAALKSSFKCYGGYGDLNLKSPFRESYI